MNNPPVRLFLDACGASDPIRVGVGSKEEMLSETLCFEQPFLVIGRSLDSDLTLEHWKVSRRHAYIQLLGGRFHCVDLGSRTGTHGGDATERMGWLGDGRAIQIGPFLVRPESPSRKPKDVEPLPGVTWELPSRALSQSTWRMDRDIALIGRSAGCQLRIVEPDVSKFHCSLVLTGLGVWVVDLLGREGVIVNDEKVRFARLEDGDELRIGRHKIRPRYDTPPAPLVAAAPRSSAGALATTTIGLPSKIGPGTFPNWAGPGGELASFNVQDGLIADPTVMVLFQQFGQMQQQMFDQFHHTMMMMFEGFAALHRETSGSLREEFERVRELSKEIESIRAETDRLAEAARAPRRMVPPPLNGNGRGHGHPSGDPQGLPASKPAEPIKRATPPPPDPHVDIHAQLLSRLSSIQSERQNRWQKILGLMSTKS